MHFPNSLRQTHNSLIVQNTIIWIKSISINNDSFGQFKPINSERFLNQQFEYIFHFTKTGKLKLDKLAIGVKYKHERNVHRWEHKYKRSKDNVRCRGNCWFMPYKTVISKKEHPAGFPIELPENCIKLHGIKEDTVVLDPFLGAGTTLLACKKLGIKGIGIELDKEYCSIAKEKLG